MRRVWKGLALVACLFVASLLGGAGVLYVRYPQVPDAPRMRVRATPELLERGRYVADHVAICTDCHSTRDYSHFSGPVVPGSIGGGGERFGHEIGLPGTLHAANLTPGGPLRDWSDGDIARAVTMGVTREGRVLFPLMPYGSFRHLCGRDLEAVIGYLRSLAPIERDVPTSEIDFPVSLLVRTTPGPADPWACPDESTSRVERGRYLFTVAACADCHTKQDHGKPVEGLELAGGFEFPLATGGVARSANLTPHRETGLGAWSEADFVAKFRSFRDATPAAVSRGGFNTVMPWTRYAGMTDDDLGAIYAYLRTVRPIEHHVEHFTP